MKKILIICVAILMFLAGCVSVTTPEGVKPVQDFDADKYLGKWYEIARLDNTFEKKMTNVCTLYTINSNGSINVVNSGIDPETGKRSYAEGLAKFVGNSNTGFLKVSFFGPFYGAYVIFKVDDDYNYVYVAGGKNKDYLWLLSRTKTVPNDVKEDFIARSRNIGYDTDSLVWVEQG